MLHGMKNMYICDLQPNDVHDQLFPDLPRVPTEFVFTLHPLVLWSRKGLLRIHRQILLVPESVKIF